MTARTEDALVGAIIRRHRAGMQMTQEELGTAAGGVSYQQIQKYESGAKRVAVSRLLDIARALCVSASDLIAKLEREIAAHSGKPS